MGDVLVPCINCLIVMTSDGERVLAKYFDKRPDDEQIKTENTFHKKTKHCKYGQESDVFLFDQEVVVHRSGADCKFFVSSTSDENELILTACLDAIFETLSQLFHGQLDHRTILDNLELVLLTIDEVVDHGHIMELDTFAVQNRVVMRSSDVPGMGGGSGGGGGGGGGGREQPIGDLSISQALNLAKGQFQGFLASGRNVEGF